MALSFPLNLATFFEAVARVRMTMDLSDITNSRRQGNGNLIRGSHGTRIFYGSVQLITLPHADQEEVATLCEVLMDARASFQVSPRNVDQSGLQSGTLTTASGYSMTLAGMGANKFYRRGTYLSFPYSSGTKQALHKVAEPFTSTAGGVGGPFEVVPAVVPGWAASAAVQLVKPYCIGAFVPGSYRGPNKQAGASSGPSFDWEQLL